MIFIRTIVVIVLSLPRIAMAEEVVVLGGQHQNFTRLTFNTQNFLEYSQLRKGRRITITAKTKDVANFNTEKMFDRIQRIHVRNAYNEQPNSLVIELACECKTEQHYASDKIFVLDVNSEKRGAKPRKNTMMLPTKLPFLDNIFVTSETMKMAKKISNNSLLISRLDRSRDLLGSESIFENPKNSKNQNHNSIYPNECAAIQWPGMRNYKNANFPEEHGQKLKRIMKETGQFDEKGLSELVIFYISSGMFHEALQTLSEIKTNSEWRKYFSAVTKILTSTNIPDTSILTKYKTCGDLELLFSTLSTGLIAQPSTEIPTLIMLTESLPLPLFHSIAPKLQAMIKKTDYKNSADLLPRMINRKDKSILRGASIPKLTDFSDNAIFTKDQFLWSDKAEATVNQSNYTRESSTKNSQTDTKIIDQLGSYAFQYRGEPTGNEYSKAEIYALLSEGYYDDSFSRLRQSSLTDREVAELIEFGYRTLSNEQSDLRFLKVLLSGNVDLIDRVSMETQLKLIKRAQETPLSDSAQTLLIETLREINASAFPEDQVLEPKTQNRFYMSNSQRNDQELLTVKEYDLKEMTNVTVNEIYQPQGDDASALSINSINNSFAIETLEEAVKLRAEIVGLLSSPSQ